MAVPALSRVEPVTQFRSGEQPDVDAAGHGHLIGGNAGQGDGQGTDRQGVLQAPQHIGSGATGGNAHQHVSWAEPPSFQIIPARLATILQSFRTAQQGRSPPGQHPLHQLGRCAEGGGALRRVEDAQSPRGAGAQIEEAAPCRQPRRDRIDGLGQAGRRSLHCPLGLQVVLAEQLNQGQGVQLVEPLAGGIGLFGEQVTPIRAHSRPSRLRRKASSSGSPEITAASVSVLSSDGVVSPDSVVSPGAAPTAGPVRSRQLGSSMLRSGGTISRRSSSLLGRKPAGTKRASYPSWRQKASSSSRSSTSTLGAGKSWASSRPA